MRQGVKHLRNCLLLLIISGCQSTKFPRPVEPICFSNGDGTAECTFRGRSYTETNTENFYMTPYESQGRWMKYGIHLEEGWEKCKLRNEN